MYLKQYALRDWYKTIYKKDKKFEFWFGIRTEESTYRRKKYSGLLPNEVFDMDDVFPNRYNKTLRKTIKVRFPIINWNVLEIFSYYKKNKFRYNPLYDEGTNNRVGCYPCMLSSKTIQAKMFRTKFGKKQLEIIKQLEIDLGVKYEMFDTNVNECGFCKI